MKGKTAPKPLQIGIYLNRKSKASREQVTGIFRYASEHPEWELHLFTRPDTDEDIARLTDHFTPDGIIAGHPAIVKAFGKRLRRKIPNVLIDYAARDHRITDALVVCSDQVIGARAAELFLNRGYRNFAFAGVEGEAADSDAINSRNQENGFSRTIQKAGFSCASYHERPEPNTWHFIKANDLRTWLDGLPKPCAILAHSDLLAQSVLSACRKSGIQVPVQIALIGVDNEESVCESTSPTLSSIEPDYAEGGYQAAVLLDKVIHRRATSRRKAYGVLRTVERMSTQNVAGSHLRIARAQEVIRAEALNGIRPREIARRLGVSPRMLEISFRNTTGHSVRDELIAVRLRKAQDLLRTTSLPLGEVASASGFRTLSALKAIFAKRLGCSMRTYRTGVRTLSAGAGCRRQTRRT